MRESREKPRRRWHLGLLLIPFVWQVAFVPLVNDVKVHWLSVPFPMLWQMLGIVVATVAIGLTYRIDRKRAAAEANPVEDHLQP
jgi:hypothetical protein